VSSTGNLTRTRSPIPVLTGTRRRLTSLTNALPLYTTDCHACNSSDSLNHTQQAQITHYTATILTHSMMTRITQSRLHVDYSALWRSARTSFRFLSLPFPRSRSHARSQTTRVRGKEDHRFWCRPLLNIQCNRWCNLLHEQFRSRLRQSVAATGYFVAS